MKLNIINTTPHTISIINTNDEIINYKPSNLPPIRCNQINGNIQEIIDEIVFINAGPYTIDTSSLDNYKNADILIVSTIVANSSEDIRKYLNKSIRIVVPDSGPSAKRNKNGQIEYVNKFLDY